MCKGEIPQVNADFLPRRDRRVRVLQPDRKKPHSGRETGDVAFLEMLAPGFP